MTALPALDTTYLVPEDKVAAFQRDGHVLLRGVASEAEVAAYRPAITAAVDRYKTENRPLEERDTYGKAFLQITNLWTRDEQVRQFTLARRFAGIAARLLGVSGVRIYHDQALFKEPGGGPTPWHQDQFYWPFDKDLTITMWMPLVPITPDVGGMRFASGSHAAGYGHKLSISDESEEAYNKLVEDLGYDVDGYDELAPGDATFHHGWVLHRAKPNPLGTMREVMTIIYFADGLRVIEPDHAYRKFDLKTWLPGCQPGDLAASPINPLVYP